MSTDTPQHLTLNSSNLPRADGICAGSSCNATFLLTHWVRDRERLTGRPGIGLEEAVHLHTAQPAKLAGLNDRGTLVRPTHTAGFCACV